MAATTITKTTTPKATNGAGVKKVAPKGGRVGKKNNAKNAMMKMQAYFKAHRDEYKDLSFKEQQQELGKKACYLTELGYHYARMSNLANVWQWKASPENPKNST
ncbi:hypothetical protein G6011_11010 [Alternaria panax]|uniref:Uncharacterized protein n=1 Tax=Alternaria panax TaxID=48097 RepID=A0AAD4NP68_9PLEO|nr:hypothetical protein G6011_11010 [Alternaria panax]